MSKKEAATLSTTTTTATTADDTAVNDDGTCSTVLTSFSDMVASLWSSHAAIYNGGGNSVTSSVTSRTRSLSWASDDRTAKIPSVIGRLKIMDRAITALDVTPSMQSVHLMSDMAELALASLPQDTRSVLQASECGSDVAMELVRRNLTQLPILAKTLYTATAEALAADAGLTALHGELAGALELYGALMAHGVNPRARPWAHQLTEKFSHLNEMRYISWRRLMHIVGMGVTLGLEEVADGEGSDEDEHEGAPPVNMDESSSADTSEAAKEDIKKEKEMKKLQAAALAAAVPVVRTPPALCKGEVHVLETLYSTGTNVPPIRKQALDFGLGLDAAGQLEDDDILTASKLTESTIRMFQSRLKLPGKSEDEIKSALMAMVSNKNKPAATAVEMDDDDDRFFGSYNTNEELVAAAGGGMALYGINFFPNENDVTLKPYAPILAKPTFVEMAGASASFEASVLQSTEQSMATAFTSTTENGGISVARASSTSWGVSASVSGFGGAVGGSASVDSSKAEDSKKDSKVSNAFSANNKKTTTSATMVEAITCPMKSFRIPVSTMIMSEEALDSALQVDTLLKASQFLDTFGSHVSNGRHLLGGIFFRTMTMTSESEVETSTLLSAASTQMQEARSESIDGSASASGGTVGVSAAASASMKSASSSGLVTFHSTAGHSENEAHDSRAMYQTYVRSMGPNVATPELFTKALFTDTSSWTVIDRGPFEALLPVTHVLENMLSSFDPSSAGKTQLENAINLLTVAWQQRATVWKPLEDDAAVPVSLRNMIGRSFATEDAHDQIRAAVVDLFQVLELQLEANTEEAAEALSSAVLATAKEMEDMPPGRADFFKALQEKMSVMDIDGKYTFPEGTSEYLAAERSAEKLSSTDWAGFDLIWKKRSGNLALKRQLDDHLKFEGATLRLGETITVDEPIVSVNGVFRLEISGKALRIVHVDSDAVVDTLFEGDGSLGKKSKAHMEASGAFVLDLTMITGFDRTETKVVLWTAPNTEGNKGSYGRMQNNGKFAVFNSKGKSLWST